MRDPIRLWLKRLKKDRPTSSEMDGGRSSPYLFLGKGAQSKSNKLGCGCDVDFVKFGEWGG